MTHTRIISDLPHNLKHYFIPPQNKDKYKQHSTKVFGIKYDNEPAKLAIKKSKWQWGFSWRSGTLILMFGKLKTNRLYTKKIRKYSGCDYITSGIPIGIIRGYYLDSEITKQRTWGTIPPLLTVTPGKNYQTIHRLVWEEKIDYDTFTRDYGFFACNSTDDKAFKQQKDLYNKTQALKYAKEEYHRLKKNIAKMPWAVKVIEHIDRRLNEKHTRTIELIVGKKGNEGKSKLSEYLEIRGKINDKMKTQIITKTNPSDIAVAWDITARIIIFDLPMTHKIKSSDGEIFEAIKNGRVTQTKYKSRSKQTQNYMKPIVIIFTNEYPNGDMYKPDRYIKSCFEIIKNDLISLDPYKFKYFPQDYKAE